MKLPLKINLTSLQSPGFKLQLESAISSIHKQINLMSENLASGYSSSTAPPTTGFHAIGDYVKNSAPAELGVIGAKYIITGWTCVLTGEPGTWFETRTLTGN